MLQADHSIKPAALALLGLVLAAVAACIPIIPESEFISRVNDLAFSPELTCEELKVVFGVPQLTTVNDPSEIGIAFEAASVATPNGQTLHVWYLPAEADRGTILLAYGAVGEMRCYLMFAKYLHDDGWSMVMYDFEGFGDSTGMPSMTTLITDHNAVLDWTLERTGRQQVTLMGVSVGTIPSVAQAAARPEVVNAVVLDGVISLRLEVQRAWLLLAGHVERYVALFDRTLRLDEQITGVHQPIFAVVYGRDEYATPRQIRGILASAPGEVTISEFPNLMHARGPYLATDTYFARLEAFLAQVWAPPVTP
jgi:pimeloyl-ACP methyl ester carboxylesterase